MSETKVDIEKLKILTSEFRVSHPHVFKPAEVEKGSGKLNYSIEMLFEKTTTDLSVIQKPLKAALIGKFGADKSKWPKPLLMPIRDGDKPHPKKGLIPEHKGMWVVRASSSAEYSKPQVVGRDPKVMLTTEAELYPGCYARAALKAHAYTYAGKDGVKFILDAVQFTRDGKALGGRKPADQVFGVIEGDDGESDLIDNGAEAEGEDSFL